MKIDQMDIVFGLMVALFVTTIVLAVIAPSVITIGCAVLNGAMVITCWSMLYKDGEDDDDV